MGCGQSSSTAKPAPVRAAQPPPEPPYGGPPSVYSFVNLEVPHEAKTGFVFSPDVQFQTLTQDVYLPALTNLYDLGYKMVAFSVTPGSMTASGFVSLNVQSKMKTQGIFVEAANDEKGKWKLVMEKSSLPKTVFTYGLFNIGAQAQADHIFQTIARMASDGGRLVAIEVTGGSFMGAQTTQATAGGMGGLGSLGGLGGGGQMNMMMYGHKPNTLLGVDLFFNMPTSAGGEKYDYQCVPIQMTVTFNPMTAGWGGQWNITFEWENCVKQYISAGWRLVEVFLDQNNQSFTDRPFMATKVTMNVGAMFIFEKPLSKMSDNTPVYEVKMEQYRAPGKISMAGIGKTNITVKAAWENMIQMNGQNGWEVVRVLQTPATPFKGSISMTPEFEWLHYVYFQRRIVASPTPPPEVKDNNEPPPVVEVQQTEST